MPQQQTWPESVSTVYISLIMEVGNRDDIHQHPKGLVQKNMPIQEGPSWACAGYFIIYDL